MKTKTECVSLLLIVWSLSIPGFVHAQNEVKNSVLANGGGLASNGSFRALSTLGQPLTGITANTFNTVHAGFWFQNMSIVTGIEQIPSETIPLEFQLVQNYPNPFNPTTTIDFELPVSSEVRLSVYDLLGREVCVLVNEKREAGFHQVTYNASGLSSGVYFYRLRARQSPKDVGGQAGDFVQTRKLMLLR